MYGVLPYLLGPHLTKGQRGRRTVMEEGLEHQGEAGRVKMADDIFRVKCGAEWQAEATEYEVKGKRKPRSKGRSNYIGT